MATDHEFTLKEHIERRLAAMVANDSAATERLTADPDSITKPLIAEALGDDGGAGLRDITTSVHFETGDHLHFVVTLTGADEPEPEVVGLAATFDIAGTLRTGTIDASDLSGDALFGRKTRSSKKCCDSAPTASTCTGFVGCPR